ncbi:MAG TPA: AMP-binding protein [Burkholderiales bacterium]|nr:AMP-binding protein [Burkholderiales bacterium]
MLQIDPWNLRTFSPELRRRYLKEGLWTDDPLGHSLLEWLGRNPELPYCFWSAKWSQQSTFGQVREQSLRLMTGLTRRGIGKGDVVCMYVPNSIEGALGFNAVTSLGAILVPVAPFYGTKELRFILGRSRARILITAEAPTGGRLETIAHMRRELPDLEDVYVITEEAASVPSGMRNYRELVDHPPVAALPKVDPDSVCAIAFTSGTTADPKGVVHTHRSLVTENRLHMDAMPRQKRGVLVGGPISHITGMLIGVFLQPYRGKPVHIMDGWDVPTVLRVMREHDLCTGQGATVFMNSIFNHPDAGPEDIARLEDVAMGGSTIPIPFVELCESKGIKVARCYGSTEHPSITGGMLTDPLLKRQRTDGRALPGVEIRVVDEDGKDLPRGAAGELISRGPDLFAGYIDPAMNRDQFSGDGWFHTGDIGVIDEEGFFTVTDRKKDIIVRNGVKVSALEVENCLLQMPGLIEAAVVAGPSERTGEYGHAYVRVKPGATAPSLEEVRKHFERVDLARQKWPEVIEVIDEFPRTPSGKVRKIDLRNQLRAKRS